MTHLPECVDGNGTHWTVVMPGPVHYQLRGCVCHELRACWDRALRDAMEAVNNIPYTSIDGAPLVIRQEALAAIEALHGDN